MCEVVSVDTASPDQILRGLLQNQKPAMFDALTNIYIGRVVDTTNTSNAGDQTLISYLKEAVHRGVDFTFRFQRRILLAVAFGVFLAAGVYSANTQHKNVDVVAVNRDGTRILIARQFSNRNEHTIVDEGGRLIGELNRPVLSPVWSDVGELTWHELRAHKRAGICKWTSDGGLEHLTVVEGRVGIAFEDDTDRLVHTILLGGPGREVLAIRRDNEEVARFRLGPGEFSTSEAVRKQNGEQQLIVTIHRRYSREEGNAIPDRASHSVFVFDPSSGNVFPIEHDRFRLRSPEHKAEFVSDGDGYFSISRRVSPESELLRTPGVPYWLTGDTFYCWRFDREVLEIYEPGKPARAIRCGIPTVLLPARNGKLLVSTTAGQLQRIDAQSGVVKTIADVRKGWKICHWIALVGLPTVALGWLWLSYTQIGKGPQLSPLTDLLLLLMATTFAVSKLQYTSRGLENVWDNFPLTGVLAWTLLGTLSLYVANSPSVLGRGLAVLLSVLAVMFFLFKAWGQNGAVTDSEVLINSGGAFVGLMVCGLLAVRRVYGRFMLPFHDTGTHEHQVTLKQVAILTCCFAAVFSVMSFYEIYFTLKIEWLRLTPSIVLAVVSLTSLGVALHSKGGTLVTLGIWLAISLGLPLVYVWLFAGWGTWVDLCGGDETVATLMRPLPRWLRETLYPVVQFALPSLLMVIVARSCRVAGMQLIKETQTTTTIATIAEE